MSQKNHVASLFHMAGTIYLFCFTLLVHPGLRLGLLGKRVMIIEGPTHIFLFSFSKEVGEKNVDFYLFGIFYSQIMGI